MNQVATFFAEVDRNVEKLKTADRLHELSREWLRDVTPYKYAHNFTWLGRPIIQCPQDVMAVQEIIWRTKPDLIVETGVAHGGSLIFSASMLELLGGDGLVVGVDIDIRAHNRSEIESHFLSRRIKLIQGSSLEQGVVDEVHELAKNRRQVMVVLDSNHTHDHVLGELHRYASLVTKGSYLIVFDTAIEDMPAGSFPGRSWGPGNSPKSAVHEFLTKCDRFVIDKNMEAKLLITVAPDGYLKCVKD